MDVSTDISVMKNLFAQDGLVNDGLKQEAQRMNENKAITRKGECHE